MSLTQYLRSAPWDDFRYLPTIYDQDFGHVIDVNDVLQPTHVPLRAGYIRPWRHVSGHHSGKSQISNDKEGFHVAIDVQQFTPDEITVKTVDDHLVVEGQHEEKKDEHGFISRHFVRRYKLPKDVQSEGISSKLSSDGVLSILAPKSPAVEGGKVRSIPIQTTGVPAVQHIKSVAAPVEVKKEA